MAVEDEQAIFTTETREPPELHDLVCPSCAGETEETHFRDNWLLGHRFVSVTHFCWACDIVIRIDWPSAPHSRPPHG